MRSLILIIALLFASVASAQTPQAVTDAAGYSVYVEDGIYRGSGVYLGDGLYLSAWHVVRDRGNRTVYVRWPANDSRDAVKIVASDKDYDIVVLEALKKRRGGVPLYAGSVSLSDGVFFAGLAKGRILTWGARVRSFGFPGTGTKPAHTAAAIGQRKAIPGDSGGPTFTADGRVIGPLWGAANEVNETMFSVSTRTQKVLAPFRARLNRWHNE